MQAPRPQRHPPRRPLGVDADRFDPAGFAFVVARDDDAFEAHAAFGVAQVGVAQVGVAQVGLLMVLARGLDRIGERFKRFWERAGALAVGVSSTVASGPSAAATAARASSPVTATELQPATATRADSSVAVRVGSTCAVSGMGMDHPRQRRETPKPGVAR